MVDNLLVVTVRALSGPVSVAARLLCDALASVEHLARFSVLVSPYLLIVLRSLSITMKVA